MIFIKNDQTTIWIPKHYSDDYPSYNLILKHNLSGEETEFTGLKNDGINSGYWIFLNMEFNTLESGEYKYTLCGGDGRILETGLLQVMAKLADPISYKKVDKTTVYVKK